ncbi:hypothetical protein FHG87_022681, partial [Trinorchestia longiramus]
GKLLFSFRESSLFAVDDLLT